MCFVLQIINFHSHNTSLKNKNNQEYLKFVLAESHTCIFYNAVVSKNIFILDQLSLFSLRMSKCG
jgi:hypothetical protein